MLFSIITAVFNNKEHIKSAINSVLSQTNVDIEYLIMDGKSTDGTVELIKEMNLPDIVLESSKDKGIYDALNKGMLKATGDIVGILHSDDLFYSEDVLKKVEEKFNSGADIVYGDLKYVNRDDTSRVVRNWKSGTFNQMDLQLGWIAPHPSFFIKRSLLKNIGFFDLNYKISADYDFILRSISNKKYKVSYLPETLVKMRVGGESNKSLKNVLKGSREDYSIAKKYFSLPAFTVFSKVFRKVPQFFKR